MNKFFFIGLLLGIKAGYAEQPINKVPGKLMTCIACHGKQGQSINPAWPNLGGQHEQYLLKRLHDYKENKSVPPTPMTPIALGLSEQEFLELAIYYSQQAEVFGETTEEYLKRGEQLYRGGDFAKKITACIACHGPKGRGNGQAGFPALSGQNAAYVIAQLEAFQTKTRKDDLNSIMRDIAGRMSKEDMTAVAHYVQGLY